MRILLIEDDPMIGDSLQRTLQGERYAVDWVRAGAQAAGALGHDIDDLVVLDLNLLGM
jgi:DNA-binding response OmpR family regulator